MTFVFRATDIKKLGKLFESKPKLTGSNYRFEIGKKDPSRNLALEIYPQIPIGGHRGNLISVYTQNAHLQLHFCSGYVISNVMGEEHSLENIMGSLRV